MLANTRLPVPLGLAFIHSKSKPASLFRNAEKWIMANRKQAKPTLARSNTAHSRRSHRHRDRQRRHSPPFTAPFIFFPPPTGSLCDNCKGLASSFKHDAEAIADGIDHLLDLPLFAGIILLFARSRSSGNNGRMGAWSGGNLGKKSN
jgi:hypothetical protein